jgi:hypothetical protein
MINTTDSKIRGRGRQAAVAGRRSRGLAGAGVGVVGAGRRGPEEAAQGGDLTSVTTRSVGPRPRRRSGGSRGGGVTEDGRRRWVPRQPGGVAEGDRRRRP